MSDVDILGGLENFIKKEIQNNINISMYGKVIAYDAPKNTANISLHSPLSKNADPITLEGIPVCWFTSQEGGMKFSLNANDVVLVHFMQRELTSFLTDEEVQKSLSSNRIFSSIDPICVPLKFKPIAEVNDTNISTKLYYKDSYIELSEDSIDIVGAASKVSIGSNGIHITPSLTVEGESNLEGNVDIIGKCDISEDCNISGNCTIDNDLTAEGTVNLGDGTTFVLNENAQLLDGNSLPVTIVSAGQTKVSA